MSLQEQASVIRLMDVRAEVKDSSRFPALHVTGLDLLADLVTWDHDSCRRQGAIR